MLQRYCFKTECRGAYRNTMGVNRQVLLVQETHLYAMGLKRLETGSEEREAGPPYSLTSAYIINVSLAA